MEAAGYSSNSAIGQHAVFWKNDSAHPIVDLGVFGSDWSSLAYSLNDFGQIADPRLRWLHRRAAGFAL
jgi:hypothetical protein